MKENGQGNRSLAMKVEHHLQGMAVCPVDGTLDTYSVIVRCHRLIPVEEIRDVLLAFKDRRIFQEDMTHDLACILACEVETIGIHSGVRTRVTCSWG